MGKPHPIDLRERVVAFVEEGDSHREAARHFRVSPRFVNNTMILHRVLTQRRKIGWKRLIGASVRPA